ncbi:4-alpha-glucanotransferase [Corynebacterium breve]|uniref:4-alpha-glucanotransferase n=1 Tax=Corynebacterium breve TaxID=3049799 RepID=A0ABY8VJ96_9CORY|nr:4-alpha-glucanotransferase [Corynebacterium breve]WIM69051.1 4-alpha-glucanotransferase [Corynebacterium breve]
MNVELLNTLANAYGLSTSYTDSEGKLVTPPAETLLKLLRSIGVDLSEEPSDDELHQALERHRIVESTRPLPASVVAVAGEEKQFNVHVHHGAPANVWVTLEDGTRRECYQDENWSQPVERDGIQWGEATFHLPGDLPLGWHRLHLESNGDQQYTTLIITPDRLSTTDRYIDSPVYGVMAQLYSVRSQKSWGIGDFNDLGQLAEVLAKNGADFLLINPVHAAEPFPPVEDSPYLPTTRRYVNPIYIRVEDVPEFGNLDEEALTQVGEIASALRSTNTSADVIERNPIYDAKLSTLREIFFTQFSAERTLEFEDFIAEQGEGLEAFAEWCARQELTYGPDANRHAVDDEVHELARFYMWLQFLADEQLAEAQERAKKAGMKIGIMTDLAVGVHPGGADANTLAHVLVPDASVGAPPDNYNQHGQDWSQPPWNPVRLAEEGYGPWRDLLATVLRNSGGIRVDHILGLFRLFWMPRMEPPTVGTYMRFDHEAMLGVLALEAERADAVVVGEDLGTFEDWVQDALAARGVMGTSVLWFESSPSQEGPRLQHEYRQLALSSVGTHDLPPTAGYLAGVHNELREQLGLLDDDLEEVDATDAKWQGEVLDAARQAGAFEGTALANMTFSDRSRTHRGDIDDLLVGLNRYIAGTSSALTCTNLVDMVGDRRVQNQPGTNSEQYRNWCIPLTDGNGKSVLIEDLASLDLFKRVAEASKRY